MRDPFGKNPAAWTWWWWAAFVVEAEVHASAMPGVNNANTVNLGVLRASSKPMLSSALAQH